MAKAKAPSKNTPASINRDTTHDADLLYLLNNMPVDDYGYKKSVIEALQKQFGKEQTKGVVSSTFTREQKAQLLLLLHGAMDEDAINQLRSVLTTSTAHAGDIKQHLASLHHEGALLHGTNELAELLGDPTFVDAYRTEYATHAEGMHHLLHGQELYHADSIDLAGLTLNTLAHRGPKDKQGNKLPLKHIRDTQRYAVIQQTNPKQSLFTKTELAYLGKTTVCSLAMIDLRIQQLERYISAVQLHLFSQGIVTNGYTPAINHTLRALHTLITKLEIVKQLHLTTHEVVAYERFHRLQHLKKELDTTGIATTETVQAQNDTMRNLIFAGQSVLLTGPVGTGKTIGARNLVKEIITTKLAEKKRALASANDEDKLSLEHDITKLEELAKDPPFINGNAETTVRQFESSVSQIKTGNGHMLEYLPGPLHLCMKYGLPLIVDEANRLSPDVLSSLKGELAKRAGDRFTDPKTGESFIIQKFAIILTANEDHHHDTTKKFQDQIEREFTRVTIGYLPPAEYAQIIAAKTMGTRGVHTDIPSSAWTAHIDTTDATKTRGGILPKLLEAQQLIIASYAKDGTKYPIMLKGTTTQQQISSAIWDTKRFLSLRNTGPHDRHDRIKYPTLDAYVKAKVIEFIRSQIIDKDQLVLCTIFNKMGIIDTRDATALADRANPCVHLKATDFIPNLSIDIPTQPSDHTLAITTPYARSTADQYGDSYADQPFDNPYIAYAQLASRMMTMVQNNATKTLLLKITKDGQLRENSLPELSTLLKQEGTDAYVLLCQDFDTGPDTRSTWGEEAKGLQDRYLMQSKKKEKLDALSSALKNTKKAPAVEALRDGLRESYAESSLIFSPLIDPLLAVDDRLFCQLIGAVGGAEVLDPSGRLQARRDTIHLATKQAVADQLTKNNVLPRPTRQPLTAGPEYDRIMQYRTDFKTQIKKTTKEPAEIIRIGEALIANGEFSLRTQGGLTVGHFALPGFTGGFATSDQVFKDKDNDPNNMLEEHEYHNKVLSKGKKYRPYLDSLPSDDIAKWKEPIKTSVEQLALQGVVYDQGGKFKKLIQELMTLTKLEELDTLAVYMYLTGQYGDYVTGQYINSRRSFVRLNADTRRIPPFDNADRACSLLFTVTEGQGPLLPQVQAYRAWWENNIQGIGTKLIDPISKQPVNFANEATCKKELIARMDRRAAQHITHIQHPRGLDGLGTQLQHPRFNGGKPINFYEPTILNFNSLTGNRDSRNLSRHYYEYPDHTKLAIRLRSIRGDLHDPKNLPDMIHENEINKTGKQEKNHTKAYLLALQQTIPTYRAELSGELFNLMTILGNDLGLPPELGADNPLRKAALMYLLSLWGLYRIGEYKNDGRIFIGLEGTERRFGTNNKNNDDSSLLFARNDADAPVALAHGVSTPSALWTAQIALRTQRPDEVLPDGSNFWDACDALKYDPTFFRYGVNAAGDATATFVEPNLTCRIAYLRTDGMKAGDYENGKNDYKSYTDKELMPTTTSTGSKACIFKNTIDTMKPAWKKQMDDDCYARGCRRQTKAELDAILNSLAKRLGIPYDATSTVELQQVIKAYMYLKGSLGRERLNTDHASGKNGDMYGQINGSKISDRWILYCRDRGYRLGQVVVARDDCSLPLMCS